MIPVVITISGPKFKRKRNIGDITKLFQAQHLVVRKYTTDMTDPVPRDCDVIIYEKEGEKE